MLEHGGNLLAAAKRYGIPVEKWLDLSTGINPNGWPVPPLPPEIWQHLPYEDGRLEQAAAAYYGCASLLPIPGSQAAIQWLPRLRQKSRVAVISPCYEEHAYAWQLHGHDVLALCANELDQALDRFDVVVLCNPCNPTGVIIPPDKLLQWRSDLASRNGWLIVDEAFMDGTPQFSVLDGVGEPGLIVLRSIGKFFGLAGLRLGFVFAWDALLQRLHSALGPWCVSGPARHIARLALGDVAWQQRTRRHLAIASDRLRECLTRFGLPPTGGLDLFQWLPHAQAAAMADFLAHRGIWVRYFPALSALRFGLPPDEQAWQTLAQGLTALAKELR